MKRHVITAFCLIVFFFSCTNRDTLSSESSFVSKGEYDNKGHEIGPWQIFYKTDNHLVEEGSFINGVRTGKWNYYTASPDTITWLPFNDASGSVRTNIPNFLTLSEENENLIRFNNSDSNRLFTLVIGKGYTTDTTNLEAYKEMIYGDLSSRGVSISDSATNFIETSHRNKYLFSFVYGSTEKPKENFILLNIAGKVGGRLIEVSLRCDKQYDDRARKVFFSVLPNLFVDSLRFIFSKDIITSFENDIK